jgi:diguanylate cyclase (GGDEF)-like protein
MLFKWLHFLLIVSVVAHANAVKLESETIPFDIKAASMQFTPVSGHKGLDLTNSSLVSDDNGYLWVGTQDGLVRLDGYSSKRFVANSKGENSLVSNFVLALAFEQSQKRLWIGTSRGLSIYDLDSEKFQNYVPESTSQQSLSNAIVQSIFIDGKGRVWIGTKNGLNRYQPDSQSFKSYFHEADNPNSLSHNNILDIKEDNLGNLWVATQSGINRFYENGKFERFYPFQNDDGSQGLVTKIAVDPDNKLWLGTEQNGLLSFDPKTQKTRQFLKQSNNHSLPSNYIRSLLIDNTGQLWVGTGGGVSIYQFKDDRFLRINNERLNGNVVSLFQDRNEVIWLGTWSKGLLYYNPRQTQVGNLNLKMLKSSDQIVEVIIKGYDDDIWFANSRHVYKMQSGFDRIIKYDLTPINPSNNRAIPFAVKSKRSLYLLTDKIYSITDTQNVIPHELPAELRNISWYSVTVDSKDRIWLGSRSVGIYVLSPDFKKIEHHIQSSIAGFVRQIDDKTMLVGSFTGTYWIDIETMQWVIHRPEEITGMLHPNVTGYYYSSEGKKWLATSGGIHQLKTDPQGHSYYETWTQQEDGLPTDVLTGPLEDSKGNLWFSSTDGLIVFNPRDNSIEQFDESQGAFTNYYIGQYLRDNDSRMFFLGPNGMSIIDESAIRNNQTKYQVVIDEFRIQNKVQLPGGESETVLNSAIQYTETLTLPPQKRDFTFSFTTTYLAHGGKAKYFYRLLGFDDQWQQTDASNRLLKYTNLNPGKYRFEIYSLTPRGVRGEISGLDLSLKPYYYETLWFKIAVSVIFMSLLYSWYKYRMYKIKVYNQQLEVEVQQRTQDIRTLANIGKDISSLLDIHELLEHLYIHLNKSLEVNVLAVGIYQPEKNRIKFDRSLENGEIMPTHYRSMNASSELAAWCIQNNKELILNKHEDRFQYIEHNSGPVVGESMNTVVYLPICSRTDKMLGCITVQSKLINAYSHDDLEFIRTIANYTGIALDNALAHRELKKVSTTDFLTNLLNRRAFLEKSLFQIKIFNRTEQPLTFAIADIDYFKLFNDRYGHDCGDHVLQKVANLFRENIREQDVVARWGGEEFVFMLPNTPLAGAEILFEKLRCTIENEAFEFQQENLKVTCTFGIAIFRAGVDMEDVLNQADLALYQGKEAGRNRVQIYESERVKHS